ncbi:MAG: hypothetical protein QOJ13_2830 [Gaiellales bacterium]|jgi:probable F420-dependent oxidoreductase|nr:hypothetical protein [Gaiellales bacterium]
MADRPVRVGVQIRPQHGSYKDMRDAWLRVEDMGADALFTWDHFFPLFGDPDGMHFECWSLLAAMAEVTEKVAFGPLVTCNSYRNPNLLADMARTVDHIGGGRLIFGIGSGWFERDYIEYGYEFGTVASRLRHLDRNMPIIKDRWTKLNPPPVHGRPPIMIGGGGEKVTLRITAEHADIWHGFGDPERFRHKCGVLDEWCRKVGRDPSEIERSCGGITAENVSQLDEFLDAGATFLTMGSTGPDWDLSLLPRLLEWRDSHNGTR